MQANYKTTDNKTVRSRKETVSQFFGMESTYQIVKLFEIEYQFVKMMSNDRV
jgi:hypothetical protein